MGFNKKYSTKSGLLDLYERGGISEIISSYSKTDAIVFMDEFSSKVYELIIDKFENKAIELLEKEINIRT